MLLPVSPTFQANFNSPKLKFRQEDFFINIDGYGKNRDWADEVIKTTDSAVDSIRKNTPVENVLKLITNGIKAANLLDTDTFKRQNTGILRARRDGWDNKPSEAFTCYTIGKYSSYQDKLDAICSAPLEETPHDLGISRPIYYTDIYHSEPFFINNSLNHIFETSKNIFPKFIKQDVKEENLPDINDNIAEIRWVLAHATPWMRGSDAISNVFMRAMYKAIGIKTYPVKEGISLDLEAYCTELSDYKKRFADYFEKKPEIVE